MRSYQSIGKHFDIPTQCREGPISIRSCTDMCCCLFYLLLLFSVIFLGAFSGKAALKSFGQLEAQLRDSTYAQPILAISGASLQIILALLCTTAICIVLVITTFMIPSLVAYIYIPLFPILMLLVGAGFLYRYFGNKLPFIAESLQTQIAQEKSLMALGVASIFIFGFIVSVIVILLKKEKIKHIVPVLRLAKSCFWQNFYMFFLSFFLSAVSILALYANLRLFEISLDTIDGQKYMDSRIFSLLVLVEALWTHGVMEALSDFLFQGIAIHWYFNEKRLGKDYSKITNNLCSTVGLAFTHIGTIIFGHILAYIPESLNVILSRMEESSTCCYNFFCLLHKCTFNSLSKFCYNKTILQSKSFCDSNRQMSDIRSKAKSVLPELYMMGNFYITLAKVFIVMLSLVISYFMLIQSQSTDLGSLFHIIGPLAVTLVGSIQIANHFMDSTGLVGDTIVFMYVIDLEIEKNYFQRMETNSCPIDALEVIHAASHRDPYND